jgi:Response regulator of the LytR/AlgR family
VRVRSLPAGSAGQKPAGDTNAGVTEAGSRSQAAEIAAIMIQALKSAHTPERKGGVTGMKKVNIRFELEPALDEIEVVIRASAQDEHVTALMERLSERPPDSLTVFDGFGNLRTLSPGSIILASVEGKLVNIITDDGSWYTRQSLQSLEDTLDKNRFLRISRYELVNLDKVLRYDFTLTGTLRLELAGGMETWASRRCIPAIRKRLLRKEEER